MRRSSSLNRRGIFYLTDEKFVKHEEEKPKKKLAQLQTYKFRRLAIFPPHRGFQKNNVPIAFQTTPDTLLNLAARVVDALSLPSVYDWTNMEVCRWIRQYGYPQYQNTFRVNLITGRKLLLVDAQSLSAMNIKNFTDIKHIAYGIRQLFYFEMTKFMRSISLPPEYYYELYKLFKVSSGPQHAVMRRTDLWRRLQLLRSKSKPSSHWDLLERWLERQQDPVELIGSTPRCNLYRCTKRRTSPDAPTKHIPCTCPPPCSCHWTEVHLSAPTTLSVLAKYRKTDANMPFGRCITCFPPCSCNWPSRFYKFNDILNCLKQNFPNKYDEKQDIRSCKYYEGSFNSTMSYAGSSRKGMSNLSLRHDY